MCVMKTYMYKKRRKVHIKNGGGGLGAPPLGFSESEEKEK